MEEIVKKSPDLVVLYHKIILILIPIFIWGCDRGLNPPEYISRIPDIEKCNYFAFDSENPELEEVVEFEILRDISDGEPLFLGRPYWIEKINKSLWVADPFRSSVLSYDLTSHEKREVAINGRGPGEVAMPAAIATYVSSEGDSIISVLDSGAKRILNFNPDGTFINTFLSKHITTEFFFLNLKRYDDQHFLVTMYDEPKYLLGLIDNSGALKSSMVERILPQGYQPVMHNRIQFDYDQDNNVLFYAYNGLPLLFVKSLRNTNHLKCYNYYPGKEISEFNIDFAPKPRGVEAITKSITVDLFAFDDMMLVLSGVNKILLFNHRTNELIKTIKVVDEDGEPLNFSQMIYSDGKIILVNRTSYEIYMADISQVI